jgi:hypothetical protein
VVRVRNERDDEIVGRYLRFKVSRVGNVQGQGFGSRILSREAIARSASCKGA